MVYTSSTLSLAALEQLAHLVHLLPLQDLVAVPAEIPPSVAIVHVQATALPPDWRSPIPPVRLAEIGSDWIDAGRSAVLAVPSVIVPQELNYLLNPQHPQFKRSRIGRPEPFYFDPRLGKRHPGSSWYDPR